MFFHKATGRYGHVNMTMSGDMDLNPVGGEYRFSAKIPGVEINELMLTLKARPPPYPVAGVLKGDFFCQGALDVRLRMSVDSLCFCHGLQSSCFCPKATLQSIAGHFVAIQTLDPSYRKRFGHSPIHLAKLLM